MVLPLCDGFGGEKKNKKKNPKGNPKPVGLSKPKKKERERKEKKRKEKKTFYRRELFPVFFFSPAPMVDGQWLFSQVGAESEAVERQL